KWFIEALSITAVPSLQPNLQPMVDRSLPIVAMSLKSGIPANLFSPEAKTDAARMGSAAFFAPLITTSPLSALLPRMINVSIKNYHNIIGRSYNQIYDYDR